MSRDPRTPKWLTQSFVLAVYTAWVLRLRALVAQYLPGPAVSFIEQLNLYRNRKAAAELSLKPCDPSTPSPLDFLFGINSLGGYHWRF
jgi:hypothetical protein